MAHKHNAQVWRIQKNYNALGGKKQYKDTTEMSQAKDKSTGKQVLNLRIRNKNFLQFVCPMRALVAAKLSGSFRATGQLR